MDTDNGYNVQMWSLLTGDGVHFLGVTYYATEYSEEQVVILRAYSTTGACIDVQECDEPLQALDAVRTAMSEQATRHFEQRGA